MKPDELKATYAALADSKLIQLYKERTTLSAVAFPILMDELKTRGLSSQLPEDETEENPDYNFTDEELKEFVNARLLEGESLESISTDLKRNGIDIKQKLKDTMLFEQQVIDHVLTQAVDPDNENVEKISAQEKYNLSDADLEQIKTKYKSTRSLYLAASVVLTLASLLYGFVFLRDSVVNDRYLYRYLIFGVSFLFASYKSFQKYKVLRD